VTKLSTYPSCRLHCQSTTFHIDKELLISDCMQLPNIAASDFKYCVTTCILGKILGGGNCSLVVNYLVSALPLCSSQGRV